MNTDALILETKHRLMEMGLVPMKPVQRSLVTEHEFIKAELANMFRRSGTFLLDHALDNIAKDMSSDGIRRRYHTFSHTMTMWRRLADMRDTVGIPNSIYQRKLLALLYHDGGHSLGAFDDDVNISIATLPFLPHNAIDAHNFMRTFPDPSYFYNDVADHNFEHNYMSLFFADVRRTIQVTRFPYVSALDEDDQAAIIRDVDITTAIEEDWFEQIYEGLFNEINHGRYLNGLGAMSFMEFCSNQIGFVESMKMHSRMGKKWVSDRDYRPLMAYRAHAAYQVVKKVREDENAISR